MENPVLAVFTDCRALHSFEEQLPTAFQKIVLRLILLNSSRIHHSLHSTDNT